jgi:ribosomal protein S18 acetylase RimI-like enzyme
MKEFSRSDRNETIKAPARGFFNTSSMISTVNYSHDDEPFIRDLFYHHKTNELQAYSWPADFRENLLSMQYMAQQQACRQEFPNAEHKIIHKNGQAVGWLTTSINSQIHIINLIIHKDFRNQGVGTAILKQILEDAGRQQKKVTMLADRNNPAIQLYLRLGFHKVKEEQICVFLST